MQELHKHGLTQEEEVLCPLLTLFSMISIHMVELSNTRVSYYS